MQQSIYRGHAQDFFPQQAHKTATRNRLEDVSLKHEIRINEPPLAAVEGRDIGPKSPKDSE